VPVTDGIDEVTGGLGGGRGARKVRVGVCVGVACRRVCGVGRHQKVKIILVASAAAEDGATIRQLDVRA
jgi:hypothetical protein